MGSPVFSSSGDLSALLLLLLLPAGPHHEEEGWPLSSVVDVQ
jgi:hypothetical protein